MAAFLRRLPAGRQAPFNCRPILSNAKQVLFAQQNQRTYKSATQSRTCGNAKENYSRAQYVLKQILNNKNLCSETENDFTKLYYFVPDCDTEKECFGMKGMQ